jgi:hypothetical protein
MAINKLGSPYNWDFIDIQLLPNAYNNSNVKEDFELLFFQENFDCAKLKEILRSTVREPNQSVRKYFWKRILSIEQNNNIQSTSQKYEEKRAKLFGKSSSIQADLPAFVDNENILYYFLNDNGKKAVLRVLCTLAAVHPDITFSPLLLPLASLFLHYMNENECFACLLAVIESDNKITQTEINWQTTGHVFRSLAKKYCKSSYDYIVHAIYKCTNNVDKSFKVIDDYVWWIFKYLPFNYMLNIVDSFLLQGQKVLYRFGIVILDQFVKCLVRKPHALDIDCINDFCRTISIQCDKLNRTAFSLRNMSRKDLDTLFQAEEKHIIFLRAKAVAHDLVTSRELHENKAKHTNKISDTDHDFLIVDADDVPKETSGMGNHIQSCTFNHVHVLQCDLKFDLKEFSFILTN